MMSRLSVDRPYPTFLNSRLRYGILLSTGGPNSLRDSASRFRPPMTTVPPSGTTTVVSTMTSVKAGCWTYCVTRIGWPAPRFVSFAVKIGMATGATVVSELGTTLVRSGWRFNRTNRRSAEMTGVIVRFTPLVVRSWLFGTMAYWPVPGTFVSWICVTKY